GSSQLMEIHLTGAPALTAADFQFPAAPAGTAGAAMNLALASYSDGTLADLTVAGLPAGWTLSSGSLQADGSWVANQVDLKILTVTAPAGYVGAEVLNVLVTWVDANGLTHVANVADNVEAYAPGSPIFAWSGDDTLTGSAGADEFVFSQPIGTDTVHSFDASADTIDLIGYAGVTSLGDVAARMADDAAGNAVITLGDGQSITLDGVSASSL